MKTAELVGPGSSGRSVVAGRLLAFDVLRIAAALGVIYSHSFRLLGHPEPTIAFGRFALTLGLLCVGLFFTLSGYLVSSSWVRHPRARVFALKRFARIWPGLLVCLVLVTFVVGPIVTHAPLGDYLRAGRTWSYVGQGAQMHITREPAGVFTTNPYPGVNGSLWTLPHEIVAYIGVMLVGLAGAFRRRWAVAGLALVMLVAFEVVTIAGRLSHVEVYGMALKHFLLFGSWFVLGALIFNIGLVPTRRLGMLSIVGAGLAIAMGSPVLFVVTTAVIFIWMGLQPATWARPLQRAGDPSYGTYIYAFPVQQTLIWAGFSHQPKLLFAASAPIAVILGFLSWNLVESKALTRLNPRKARVAVD